MNRIYGYGNITRGYDESSNKMNDRGTNQYVKK
jgi:hypothetical protein